MKQESKDEAACRRLACQLASLPPWAEPLLRALERLAPEAAPLLEDLERTGASLPILSVKGSVIGDMRRPAMLLYLGFDWANSRQGFAYWERVYHILNRRCMHKPRTKGKSR